ncbi:MAG TPA: hypothetical protein VKY74_23210 [Chloroflexia bacterium]|nr:hypothetical protein [Chloroflexia bacterium]
MRLALWRYELRVLGPVLFVVPVLIVVGLGGLAAVLDLRAVNRGFLAQLVVASLEACLPLAGGVTAASVTARDPALELLLTLPVSYGRTAFRRLALLLGWTGLVALGATLVLRAAFPWALTPPPALAQLIWLGPLLCCAGAGAWLALLLRSGAASGAVLGGIWVAQLAFHGYFAATGWTQPWFLFATLEGLYTGGGTFWATNRIDLLILAAGLFGAVWAYLRHLEWRLRSEEG